MINNGLRKKYNQALILLLLILFVVNMITGIIKIPEIQRYFLFIYNYISAAQMSWLHDYSGLGLAMLIIVHLVVKRRWLGDLLKLNFKISTKLFSTLFIIVVAGLFLGVVYYVKVNDIINRKTTNLSAVEIKEYKGEKLGSIDDFRENSIKGVQYVNRDTYKLEITGLISNPIDYSYDDILKLPSYQKVVKLDCVEGWSVKALWEGILVKDILKNLNIKPEAKTVIFYASDGYSTSFPLDYILNNDIIMADKLNGVYLPPERGFPFQLVAEQKWGYKWIKWITKIELSSDTNYKGFWESRGYNNDGSLDGSKYAR
ncbi:MAG: molybdopterin-dependent oxidoreductase [Candidatus Falkowbacteria bacterium]